MTVVVVNTEGETIAPVTCSQMEMHHFLKPTLLQCHCVIRNIFLVYQKCVRNM